MANLALVKVGQGLTAAILNGIIGRVNGQALTGIVPSSVAGGGASVGGRVTFTNTAAISVNGVFTTDFDNYRIVWNLSTRSASSTANFRLRQTGADVTTATYNWSKGYDSGTTRTVQSATAATAAPLDITQSAGQSADGYTDLFGPALGTYTAGLGLGFVYGGGTPGTATTGFQNSTATPSDGFTMYPTSGTFTGTLRVYGYNNLV